MCQTCGEAELLRRTRWSAHFLFSQSCGLYIKNQLLRRLRTCRSETSGDRQLVCANLLGCSSPLRSDGWSLILCLRACVRACVRTGQDRTGQSWFSASQRQAGRQAGSWSFHSAGLAPSLFHFSVPFLSSERLGPVSSFLILTDFRTFQHVCFFFLPSSSPRARLGPLFLLPQQHTILSRVCVRKCRGQLKSFALTRETSSVWKKMSVSAINSRVECLSFQFARDFTIQ